MADNTFLFKVIRKTLAILRNKMFHILKLWFNENSQRNKWSWTLKQKLNFLFCQFKVRFVYKTKRFSLNFSLFQKIGPALLFFQIQSFVKENRRIQYPITVSFIIKSTKNVQLPINACSTASWHGGRELSFH